MPRVTVRIPGMLARFADDTRDHTVTGETTTDCIDVLLEVYPELEPHLRDGQGRLRDHLLVYRNDLNVAWIDADPVPVSDGDTVEVFQAVSGG